jgi:hypothetical protein
MSRFGGVRRILVKPAGTGAFPAYGAAPVGPCVDLGEVKEDSTHETKSFAEDNLNTRGEGVFAGDMDTVNANVFTQTQHSAMRGWFVAGTRLDVRIEFLETNVSVDYMDTLVPVSRIELKLKPGENSFYRIRVAKYFTS